MDRLINLFSFGIRGEEVVAKLIKKKFRVNVMHTQKFSSS